MALTEKQRAAIRSQIKKNIAKRAATQRTKVSPSEARTVSSMMNKRPGATPSFTLKDRSILTKNERDTLGATSKANADKEKIMQKNRNFAKGTGKLPVKDRVGTKAEYKQLGKDIEMRKQLIARSKAARAAKAARGAQAAPATPTAEKPTTKTKPKASTAAIKKRTSPNTNPKTSKPKVTETKKLQTLDQAKASAPKPRGPMLGPEKPSTTLTKPEGKVASKVSSTKVGSTVKKATNTTLGKSITGAAKKVGSNKLVKVGGKLVKVGVAVGVAREIAQIGSGQASKDFNRIQALENRIAAAKGQKPKYTRSGTNRNLGESLKVDAGNALSFIGLGKSRKARLTELKSMAAKAEKNKLTKPALKPEAGKKPSVVVKGGNTPSATSGNKYIVKKGDTLSAIASRSGVSLKDIRDANPKFAAQAKYKNGNMIFSGTSVTIPKKKAK
jgi:LysM repeat protein